MVRVSISETEAKSVAALLHRTGADTRQDARRLATISEIPRSVPAGLERIGAMLEGWGDDLQQRLSRISVRPSPTVGWDAPPMAVTFGPAAATLAAQPAFTLLHLLGAGSTAFDLFGAAFGDGPHPRLLDEWLRAGFPALAVRRDRLAGPLLTLRDQLETLEGELAALPHQSPATTASATLGTAEAARRQDLRNQIADLRRRADQLLTEWAPTTGEVADYLDSLDPSARDHLLFSVLTATPGPLPEWLETYRLAELRRLTTDQAVAAYTGSNPATDPATLYMEAVAATHGLDSIAAQRADFLDRLNPHTVGFWEGLSWGLIAGPYAPTQQRSATGTIGTLIGEVLAGELVVGDVRDLLYDLTHHEYGMAGLDLVGFIPFLGSAKHGDGLAAMVRHHDELLDAARRVDPLSDVTNRAQAVRRALRTFWLDDTGAVGHWSIKARLSAAGPGNDFGLPTQGRIRFLPEADYNPVGALRRGPNNGFFDRFENEWVIGPSRTPGHPFEWDVQLSSKGQQQLGWLSKDGKHINVSPFGEVTH